MIYLNVDEGYAFDYLSILQIKAENDIENKQKQLNYLNCLYELKQVLGGIFNDIIHSHEYIELCEANRETFLLVDLAKEDKVKASDVDKSNCKRYLKKISLQNKFFNDKITETKVGYEKYG